MSGYTVRRVEGCVIIEGSVPIDEFCALVGVWEQHGDEMIVDSLLAAKLQANFVIGPKNACMAWRDQLGITMPDAGDNTN